MIKNIRFFEVYDNYSVDGLGGSDDTIGRFSTKLVADKYAEGRGNYGKTAQVKLVEFDICDTVEEAKVSDINRQKREALAKLTKKERKLLGLDEN